MVVPGFPRFLIRQSLLLSGDFPARLFADPTSLQTGAEHTIHGNENRGVPSEQSPTIQVWNREFPNNQIDAWKSARLAVDPLAPEGYEFDPNLTTTRYVDNQTVYPIYVSDDGSNYSIGGEIIAASDYDSSGSSTFKSDFDAYWDASL